MINLLAILSAPEFALLEGHSRYDAVNRETGCFSGQPRGIRDIP